MQVNTDEVLTIEDLSAYLKVSKSTLYKLAQDGVLPGIKVGKHWRWLGAPVGSLLLGTKRRKTARRRSSGEKED